MLVLVIKGRTVFLCAHTPVFFFCYNIAIYVHILNLPVRTGSDFDP